MTAETPKAHAWASEHLRLAVSAAGVALWAWNVDTDGFTMDERGFEPWGMAWRAEVTFEELSAHIHPSDRDRVRSAFEATRAVLGSYETDFRILIGDEVRWVSARGQGEDGAAPHRLPGPPRSTRESRRSATRSTRPGRAGSPRARAR